MDLDKHLVLHVVQTLANVERALDLAAENVAHNPTLPKKHFTRLVTISKSVSKLGLRLGILRDPEEETLPVHDSGPLLLFAIEQLKELRLDVVENSTCLQIPKTLTRLIEQVTFARLMLGTSES